MKTTRNYSRLLLVLALFAAGLAGAMAPERAAAQGTQSTNSNVKLSKSEIVMDAAGGEAKVTVTSNWGWSAEVAPGATWVSLPGTRVFQGNGSESSQDCRITVFHNTGREERTTYLIFRSVRDTTVKAILLIRQKGRPAFALSFSGGKNEIEVGADGGKETVSVKANCGWKSRVYYNQPVDPNSEWVSSDKSSGEDRVKDSEDKVNIEIKPNTGESDRTAYIVFTSIDDPSVKEQLIIRQKGQGKPDDPNKPGSGLTAEEPEVTINGDKDRFIPRIKDASGKAVDSSDLDWSSSDTTVATVDDKGKVTIHKKGTAVITGKAKNGSGKPATIKVNVLSTVGNMEASGEARIYTAAGMLHLTLPTPAVVRIYNVSGALVRTMNAPAGNSSVALPQGIYVVKAGSKTEKVVVQ